MYLKTEGMKDIYKAFLCLCFWFHSKADWGRLLYFTWAFVWISVKETLLSKQNVTSHITEHRLMWLHMNHIEGMHLETKVNVFRCCTDTHGENVAENATKVMWSLHRVMCGWLWVSAANAFVMVSPAGLDKTSNNIVLLNSYIQLAQGAMWSFRWVS